MGFKLPWCKERRWISPASGYPDGPLRKQRDPMVRLATIATESITTSYLEGREFAKSTNFGAHSVICSKKWPSCATMRISISSRWGAILTYDESGKLSGDDSQNMLNIQVSDFA